MEVNMSKPTRHPVWLTSLVIALILVFGGITGPVLAASTSQGAKSLLQTSFAPAIKKVAPSVVTIWSSRTINNDTTRFFDDPFFRRFFGDDSFGGVPRERRERGLGSAVIGFAESDFRDIS